MLTDFDDPPEIVGLIGDTSGSYSIPYFTYSGGATDVEYSYLSGNDFLPVTGKLITFEPANNPLVRWDVGIETGSIITSDFDPMLAKVISYGETRIEAANKLVLALKNSHFGGMKTNREFLISILESKEFLKGATTTDFIKKVKLNNELGLSEDEINDYAKLAALWIQGKNRNEASVLTNMESGWNNARLPFQEVKLKMNELETSIKYKNTRNNIFKFSDKKNGVVFEWQNNFIDAEISGSRYRSKVSKDKDLLLLHTYKGDVLFKILPKFRIQEIGIVEGGLNAPMPGKVVEVKIKKGSSVKKGDTLVILEAMKMEHKVSAPANGKISKVLISQGDQVENGQTLIVLD